MTTISISLDVTYLMKQLQRGASMGEVLCTEW